MAKKQYEAIFVDKGTKKKFRINAVTSDFTSDEYLNHLMNNEERY